VKSVLVTGGAGFIGSNFVRYLLGCHSVIHIVNIDALTYAGNPENLEGLPNLHKYTFIKGDINSSSIIEKILTDFNIDTIVNFAAETHVDRSIKNPEKFIQANIDGTFNLLETARKIWFNNGKSKSFLKRFHHISTDEVYGSLKPGASPFTERTLYDPHSPYSASKAASDYLAKSYYYTYGMPITISNCSNNYGPYQYPEKLIPLTILNAIQGKVIPVYGIGNQIRDWIFVKDHCEAIFQIIKNGRIGESYNIGGNNQPTNLEIVQLICKILDKELPLTRQKTYSQLIRFIKDRPGHDYRYAMDITKIQNELGWTPKVTLENGLRDTVDWYLNHKEWVNHVLNNPQYQDWFDQFYQNK